MKMKAVRNWNEIGNEISGLIYEMPFIIMLEIYISASRHMPCDYDNKW
jgi:hypothetical protein